MSAVTSQIEAELHQDDSNVQLLQQKAERQMLFVKTTLHWTEGGEHDLGELQAVLDRAENPATVLQKRNRGVEVATVVSSCVAPFLAAPACTTCYIVSAELMHDCLLVTMQAF